MPLGGTPRSASDLSKPERSTVLSQKPTPKAPKSLNTINPPKPKPNAPLVGPPAPRVGGKLVDPRTAVIAMQTFLNHRGYNIDIDGVRGPQTNAAVLAFHNRTNPKQFNAKHGSDTRPPVVNPHDSAGVAPPKGGGGDSTPVPTPVPTPAPASTGNPALDAIINPAAFARGQVNATYDPQINEIARQQALGIKQAAGNQTDIAAWYKHLDDLQGTNIKRNADAGAAAIKGYDTAAENAGALFGGQNSDPTFHDIQAGAMRGNSENQKAFDDNMRSILAAGGVQAGVNQKVRDGNDARELAAKLLDLRGAKGSAYATAYQQGIQARTQQAAAQQSLDLAKQLAPAQVATAQAQAVTAGVNASTAVATQKANLKLINAQVAKAQAAAKATTAGVGWNLNRPNDRGQLTSALRTGLQTKGGGFRIDPISAARNVQLSLEQAGLSGDPQAQAVANSLIQETLNNAHSKHLWGGFKWDGTKVVRSGRHFDPKTHKLVKGQRG